MVSVMCKLVILPILVAVAGVCIKIFITPPLGELEPVDLRGKTFVITGATSGLGKWQAEVLASWNATLVLPVRDVSRGNSFAEGLSKRYPNAPVALVKEMRLDSLTSVRKFADDYQGPVDVLVHNAALLGEGYMRRTEDGFEECFQVNYLSTVLLTSLLVDRIESSTEGRIVHVSAKAHEWANISVDAMRQDKVLGPDFPLRQNFKGNLGGSYADSKLAQMLFNSASARRLKKGTVTHALHPAIVKTGLDRNMPESPIKKFIVQNIIFRIGRAVGFAQSEDDAPKTQIHVSTHPSLQAVSGRYYSCLAPPLRNCGKPAQDCAWEQHVSPAAKDEQLQEEVFKASCELLELGTGLCARPAS
eukprot:TRINITY_DN40922_c0_g1_i1.p1 TRINITY_DN40922_c0_g1~~TRINITY_DN40922_c0_g1_i1.p1  ORF type:complete len:360 (+),score=34.47 TRINITY_DN40922_c0_g1_i1:55-1134(+)